MTTDALMALAGRIERGDGEPYALNILIADALGHAQLRGGQLFAWSTAGSTNEMVRAANYLGSFDAALTTVPDDYDWIVGNVNGQYGGTPYACVGSLTEHHASTACRALCVAGLRARACL